ncbi:MAG: hypothetical protein CM1200mP21_07480 [Candidatus Poseidoniales archaeon]|nr:MAG: hypothetical protein CM1200mP21_07480 [Candidatus Poseidoniales archaeon]
MDVRTVAVIGAGTMGAGIAQVCAQTGWETRLYDPFSLEGLENGVDSIHGFWDKGIARGKTTEQQKSEWSANLSSYEDLVEAVAGADLVIEAVPEGHGSQAGNLPPTRGDGTDSCCACDQYLRPAN